MSIYTQRLASQIEFIKQCALLKKAPIQDFAKHTDFTCTEEQVLGLPGISLNITDDISNEVWLRLERLRENSVPKSDSPILIPWLILPSKFNDQPSLKQSIATHHLDKTTITSDEVFTPFDFDEDDQKDLLSDIEDSLETEVYLKNFSEKEAIYNEYNNYIHYI